MPGRPELRASATAPRTTSATGPGPLGQAELVRAGAVLLAAVLAFAPSLRGGFVFDDLALFGEGSPLRGPAWRLWLTSDPVDFWPLTYSSLWIEWRLWGADPLGYRVVNLALHAGTAILLWRALRRLEVPGAWLGGLLYAVHPVTVESVAWISERKNVLSGILYAGAILAWLRYREQGRRTDHLVALGAFLMALLAKTSTVMLPPVLLGLVLWRNGRLARRDLVETAPFFALAVALGAVTIWFQHVRSFAGAGDPRGVAERVGGAGWALASYLRTAFLPVHVPLVAPPWPARPDQVAFWVPLAAVVMAAAALVAFRSGPARPLSFALGYHALLVFPVLGLADMAYLRIAPVASHLQYLALMGPVALAAAGLARISRPGRWRRVGVATAAAVVLGLAALTAGRARAFQDDLAFWEAAERLAPQSRVAALAYADRLGQAGAIAEARRVLARAAERLRDPADRRRAASILLVRSGRFEEGLAEARAAEALRPDPFFQRDLGELLIAARRYTEAIAVLEPVVRGHPASPEHRYWLGSALALSGRLAESAAVLRPACGASRGHFGTCTALVMVLARMGHGNEARAELASALGVAGDDPLVGKLIAESGVREAR